MKHYYRESNGTYLSIDLDTYDYFRDNFDEESYEGRACVSVWADVTYVNTCTISKEYLKTCTRVLRTEVPRDWLKVL